MSGNSPAAPDPLHKAQGQESYLSATLRTVLNLGTLLSGEGQGGGPGDQHWVRAVAARSLAVTRGHQAGLP